MERKRGSAINILDEGEPLSRAKSGAFNLKALMLDDEFPDDSSYKSLDYALATSHSTYLADFQDSAEDLEDYQ